MDLGDGDGSVGTEELVDWVVADSVCGRASFVRVVEDEVVLVGCVEVMCEDVEWERVSGDEVESVLEVEEWEGASGDVRSDEVKRDEVGSMGGDVMAEDWGSGSGDVRSEEVESRGVEECGCDEVGWSVIVAIIEELVMVEIEFLGSGWRSGCTTVIPLN